MSKRFSSSQQHSNWFCPVGLRALSSGVKWLEADRSPLSSAWSYTAFVHSAIDLRDLMFNYVKVKESRNRPDVAQRVPGGFGFKIFVTFGT